MMKKLLIATIVVLCCFSVKAQIPRHVVTYTPTQVHVGDTVRVTYNFKEPTAAFRVNAGAYLLVYTFTEYPLDMSEYPKPVLKEVPMMRRDSTWTAGFVMDIPDAKFFTMRFESSQEEDDNNRHFWTGLIYGKNGAPVRDAYAFRAYSERGLAGDSTYHMMPDIDGAQSDLEKEIKLYPDNFMAWDMKFRMMSDLSFGISVGMFGQIDSVIKATDPALTERTAPRIAHWYTATGKPAKAREIEDEWIRRHPHSDYAIATEFGRAETIRDPASQYQALENLAQHTAADTGAAVHLLRMWMVKDYLRKGNFAGAESTLVRMPDVTSLDRNEFALDVLMLSERADSSQNASRCENALRLERAAIDSEQRHPLYMKDDSRTENDKRMREDAALAAFHYTAARLELRIGEPDSAFGDLLEALHLNRTQNPDIVSAALHLMITLAKNGGKDKDGLGGLLPMLAMGASGNDTLWSAVEQTYKQFSNPPITLDQLKQMTEMMKQRMREESFCRHVYRAAAPAFSLPSLGGKGSPDTLPKGKVVVLDFWGTWCAPCRVTLPKLDSVYQEFKSNDDVRFYAIDCGEQPSSFDSLRAKVRSFVEDGNISMPVLFDTAGTAAKAYQIVLYPTRVIIDKQGIIRVWDIGYTEEPTVDKTKFELDQILDNVCDTVPH